MAKRRKCKLTKIELCRFRREVYTLESVCGKVKYKVSPKNKTRYSKGHCFVFVLEEDGHPAWAMYQMDLIKSS